MAIEKKWASVPPRLLTANGGTIGQLQIADTRGFKVKQIIVLNAVSLPPKQLQVKRVISDTLMFVGEPDKPIHNYAVDLSAYTTALSAYVYAEEQDKSLLKPDDMFQATYDQEPTVAWRSVLVDQLGRYYETANPVPVRLTDGSINIETLNAQLEVFLTHLDNFPKAGDIHDSIRVGDGVEELGINPDQSINVNQVNTLSYQPVIQNIEINNANQEYSFTFPNKSVKLLIKIRDGMAKLQFCFEENQSDTTYMTLAMGAIYKEDANLSNKTIYFRSNKPNQTLELMYWVQG